MLIRQNFFFVQQTVLVTYVYMSLVKYYSSLHLNSLIFFKYVWLCILGIKGLQPPDLKGGTTAKRPTTQWSCYDPDRPDRVDYDTIMMPSAAMERATAGNLIEVEHGGEFTRNPKIWPVQVIHM